MKSEKEHLFVFLSNLVKNICACALTVFNCAEVDCRKEMG